MKRISWFDIKTKTKHLIRRFIYSALFQKITVKFICSYLRFVLFTSKKEYHNFNILDDLVKNNKSFIIASWHGRIAMSHVFSRSKKFNKNYKFNVLASNHGDGAIISKVMQSFNIGVVYGSTRKKNNSKRGIDIANFRKIFKILKSGSSMCITPDGPRGPRHKVSGHLINIAKITKSPIIPISCSVSRKKIFNSWDKFILPLPFSKIIFYVGKKINIDKDSSKEKIDKYNKEIEDAINDVCKISDNLANNK